MLDLDPVRQHLGAAGNGRAVAAGFADHGSRLAGNGRLIHRSHAFNHFAVARDVVAGLDVNHVSCAKQAADDLFKAAVGRVALGDGLALGLAQRVGLRLAAALGHGLGKVGEQHREPQPERDLQIEAEAGAMMDGVVDQQRGGEHAAHFHHKHHRVLDHPARVELANAVHARLGHDLRVPKTRFFSHDSPFRLFLVRCRWVRKPARCVKLQVFQDRSQAQRREEGERAEDHDHADQQHGKQRGIHREGAGRRRHALLLRQVAGQGQHGNHHEEPADEHVPAHRDVVPPVGAQAGEGRAVVARARNEGVEDLGEPVRAGIGGHREPDLGESTKIAAKERMMSGKMSA